MVLLAVCDAKYCFTMFDVGQYGSNNDSGVLLKSKMGKKLAQGSLNIPSGTIFHAGPAPQERIPGPCPPQTKIVPPQARTVLQRN